jgi:hypothetical protein
MNETTDAIALQNPYCWSNIEEFKTEFLNSRLLMQKTKRMSSFYKHIIASIKFLKYPQQQELELRCHFENRFILLLDCRDYLINLSNKLKKFLSIRICFAKNEKQFYSTAEMDIHMWVLETTTMIKTIFVDVDASSDFYVGSYLQNNTTYYREYIVFHMHSLNINTFPFVIICSRSSFQEQELPHNNYYKHKVASLPGSDLLSFTYRKRLVGLSAEMDVVC